MTNFSSLFGFNIYFFKLSLKREEVIAEDNPSEVIKLTKSYVIITDQDSPVISSSSALSSSPGQ